MTARVSRQLILAALTLMGSACVDSPLDRNVDGEYPNHNGPAGRIEGTLLYEGPPPPLDASGVPLGRVVLLLFRANNPPPPDGFATTAETLQALPASLLFAGATALPGGRVRASVPFVFPSIGAAGEYQLRAFYSARSELEGFHPLYGVRSQPVRGDVVGGAVADPTAVASPRFVSIGVGRPTTSASGTTWTMPEQGAVTRGVTVFLGVPSLEDRPIFRVGEMPPPSGLMVSPMGARPAPGAAVADYAARTGFLSPTARALVFPSNLPAGIPDDLRMISAALPSFTLEAGIADSELPAARNAGVVFDNAMLRFTLGPLYRPAHPTLLPVPVSATMTVAVPWTYPLVLFVKLHDPTAEERAVLSSPTPDPATLARIVTAMNQPERAPGVAPIVLFGVMAPDTGIQGIFTLPTMPVTTRGARVVMSPIAVEVRPDGSFVPIAPRLPPGIAAALGALRPDVRCTDEGLPTGRYAITLVTRAGQTWSTPNELSPYAFPPNTRIAVESQGVVLRIDRAPVNPAYACPTPRM
jgi:hypothetical protein